MKRLALLWMIPFFAVRGAAVESVENEEDTAVILEKIERPTPVGADRDWLPPNYSAQEQALGYNPDAFETPKGMEGRVQFWVNIYTQLTTDQGILHDSRYLDLIYETIDFADITQSSAESLGQKEKLRKKRVKQVKKDIEARLLRLQRVKGPEGLDGDDLRYWKLFENISEKNKFSEASRRGRLRFQLGQRDRFIEGIYQSGRHITEMEEIFRREGLPVELTRLPFVESSFNLKARSKVGASGIWQFMRSTARAYMRMDAGTDERNDPLRATLAAARKLRNNFQMLEAWPLAVTGYNHGPSGVQRLVKKFRTTNLAELTDVRKGRFGFASANFYASFLAAVEVEKHADKYFGPLKRMAELRGQEVKLNRPLSVAQLIRWFNDDLEKAQMYNPHIRNHVWPKGILQAKNFIRVPTEAAGVVASEIEKVPTPAANITSVPSEKEVVLQPGETLGEIAERYRIKVQVLLDINGISEPRRIRAGTKLIIPENQ